MGYLYGPITGPVLNEKTFKFKDLRRIGRCVSNFGRCDFGRCENSVAAFPPMRRGDGTAESRAQKSPDTCEGAGAVCCFSLNLDLLVPAFGPPQSQ